MSKSKFSKRNSYDEIVMELSILNLLKHIHKKQKNLKMSFLEKQQASMKRNEKFKSSSEESGSFESESESVSTATDSSYYDDEDFEEKPQKVKKKA